MLCVCVCVCARVRCALRPLRTPSRLCGGRARAGAHPPALPPTPPDAGEGQRTVIKLKLDSMADSVSGQTVIDPKGYLTDLSGMAINSSSEISDIKKV
jgi:hypothetical protein